MNVRVSAIAADLYGKVKVLGATQLYITPRQERNEINEPNVKRDIVSKINNINNIICKKSLY